VGRLAGSGQGPGKARRARPLRRGQPVLTPAPGAEDPARKAIGTSAYWQAWFDGSALPNPGKLGIGAVLLAPDGRRSEQSTVSSGTGCNNEAELHALCAALDMACQAGARHLLLRGDSDVALRYVRGPDTTRIARLQILIESARDRLRRFDEVQLLWVPRHRNLDADRLSRLALGLPESAPRKDKERRRRR
jgi:ribonuclease HI